MNVTDIIAANVTTINGLFTTANNATGNVFMAGLYFVIYMILYLATNSRVFNPPVALAGASFVQFILAVLLVLSGLLSMWFAVLPLIVLSLTLFAVMKG